jgi:hypothetical protein
MFELERTLMSLGKAQEKRARARHLDRSVTAVVYNRGDKIGRHERCDFFWPGFSVTVCKLPKLPEHFGHLT